MRRADETVRLILAGAHRQQAIYNCRPGGTGAALRLRSRRICGCSDLFATMASVNGSRSILRCLSRGSSTRALLIRRLRFEIRPAAGVLAASCQRLLPPSRQVPVCVSRSRRFALHPFCARDQHRQIVNSSSISPSTSIGIEPYHNLECRRPLKLHYPAPLHYHPRLSAAILQTAAPASAATPSNTPRLCSGPRASSYTSTRESRSITFAAASSIHA